MKKMEVTNSLLLNDLLREASGDDIVLTRDGKAVAILSPDDEEYWQAIENDPAFIESIKRARERSAKGQTRPLADVMKELGIESGQHAALQDLEIELEPVVLVDELLCQLASAEITLVQHGEVVAFLRAFDEEALYWYLREREPAFIESIAESRAEIARGEAISHEQLKKRLGIP